MHAYFKDNYDVLAPIFIKNNNVPDSITADSKTEILNMHEAYVNEGKTTFMDALGKDRMYRRPAGFMTD